jgi:hypothetical protein
MYFTGKYNRTLSIKIVTVQCLKDFLQVEDMAVSPYYRCIHPSKGVQLLVVYIFFFLTLSECENFRLCERILINVTTYQNETSN